MISLKKSEAEEFSAKRGRDREEEIRVSPKILFKRGKKPVWIFGL